MILYTIFDREVLVEENEVQPVDSHYIQLAGDNRFLELRPLGHGQAEVLRLCSTNSMDYLNPAFRPGEVIRLELPDL